jgi:hypothetical protein
MTRNRGNLQESATLDCLRDNFLQDRPQQLCCLQDPSMQYASWYTAALSDWCLWFDMQVSVYSVPAEKHLRTITLDRQHTHATTVVGLSFR